MIINRNITHAPVHLIYRLKGSMPVAESNRLHNAFETDKENLLAKYGPIKKLSGNKYDAYRSELNQLNERFELTYDEILDKLREGPYFLASAAAKNIILDSWLNIQLRGIVLLDAISVMSNHVHVILSHPENDGIIDIHKLMSSHKRFTARQLNNLHETPGRKVWASTFFDRDIRPGSYGTVFWYVVNNPLKAGLCEDPLLWSGTYVAPRLLDNH